MTIEVIVKIFILIAAIFAVLLAFYICYQRAASINVTTEVEGG